MLMSDPHWTPDDPPARPNPSGGVRNVHAKEAVSWRNQPVGHMEPSASNKNYIGPPKTTSPQNPFFQGQQAPVHHT